MRIGISLASKCYCCDAPECESMHHLFISGSMADVLWCFICPLFRKQRPGSLREFFLDWGGSVKSKRYTTFLGFGIVCLCFWEMWKIRNSILHDEKCMRFTKYTIFRCASSLSKVSPNACLHDVHSRFICHALRIHAPQISQFRVYWSPWVPFLTGNSCNVAISSAAGSSRFAAVLRNSQGVFLYGLKVSSSNKPFLKGLFHLVNDLARVGIQFSRLQASHEDIGLLGKDSMVDRSLYPVKRLLVKALQNVVVFRISFSLNLPVEALCYSEPDYFADSSLDSLPGEVRSALAEDPLLHPCSFYDQRIFL